MAKRRSDSINDDTKPKKRAKTVAMQNDLSDIRSSLSNKPTLDKNIIGFLEDFTKHPDSITILNCVAELSLFNIFKLLLIEIKSILVGNSLAYMLYKHSLLKSSSTLRKRLEQDINTEFISNILNESEVLRIYYKDNEKSIKAIESKRGNLLAVGDLLDIAVVLKEPMENLAKDPIQNKVLLDIIKTVIVAQMPWQQLDTVELGKKILNLIHDNYVKNPGSSVLTAVSKIMPSIKNLLDNPKINDSIIAQSNELLDKDRLNHAMSLLERIFSESYSNVLSKHPRIIEQILNGIIDSINNGKDIDGMKILMRLAELCKYDNELNSYIIKNYNELKPLIADILCAFPISYMADIDNINKVDGKTLRAKEVDIIMDALIVPALKDPQQAYPVLECLNKLKNPAEYQGLHIFIDLLLKNEHYNSALKSNLHTIDIKVLLEHLEQDDQDLGILFRKNLQMTPDEIQQLNKVIINLVKDDNKSEELVSLLKDVRDVIADIQDRRWSKSFEDLGKLYTNIGRLLGTLLRDNIPDDMTKKEFHTIVNKLIKNSPPTRDVLNQVMSDDILDGIIGNVYNGKVITMSNMSSGWSILKGAVSHVWNYGFQIPKSEANVISQHLLECNKDSQNNLSDVLQQIPEAKLSSSNKQVKNNNLNYTEFNNANFSNLIISDVSFIKTNLNKCYFDNCVINRDTSFTNAKFKNPSFKGCKFMFDEAKFDAANFINTNLNNADFSDAYLDHVNCSGVKMTECKFNTTNTKLSNVSLQNSTIKLSNFTGAELNNVAFEGSTIEKTRFTNTKFVSFPGHELNFKNTKMKNVDFTDAKICGYVDLRGATMGEKTYESLLKVVKPEMILYDDKSLVAGKSMEVSLKAKIKGRTVKEANETIDNKNQDAKDLGKMQQGVNKSV